MVLAIATPMLIGASLLGGLVPSAIRGTHLRMQLALSFVSGLMLGVAILHLLPHSMLMLGSVDEAAYLMLFGVVGVFLLMRFLHVHSLEPGIKLPAEGEPGHDHDHAHGGGHHHGHAHHGVGGGGHGHAGVRWVTLLSGLSLHSIVDGAALASAVKLEEGHGWPGLLVLIVVVLHKPLDALAITATMEGSEQQRRRINLIYALVAPIAAWLAYLGFTGAGDAGLKVAGIAMAFCAGAFVCVALADLMPEVQFHSHHRFLLTGALGLGVGVAVLLGYVEGHNHGMHDHGGSETEHEGHDHGGPDHSGQDHSGQDHTGHDHAGHDHD
ncbi:MAG: ZIP family metal transporter [Phycisphaerales bacterium JB058]